jgi:hypothetical protein
MMVLFLVFALALLCCSTQARGWNNTGKGSIIFEEAVSLPNLRPNAYVCVLISPLLSLPLGQAASRQRKLALSSAASVFNAFK